jgi:hypothetical protein
MKQVNMQGIEGLIDFFCFDGFGGPDPNAQYICEARDIGMTTFVECLEQDANKCPKALSYADTWYCSSRARIRLVKGLKI